MNRVGIEGGTTSVGLLQSAADWADALAWCRLVATYDGRVRYWLRPYFNKDEEAIDEVAQAVWIKLAKCLQSFKYREDGSFRGWLRRLVRSCALDHLAEQGHHAAFEVLEDEAVVIDPMAYPAEDPDGPAAQRRADRLALAVRAIESVRARVDESTWRAFHLRVIEGRSLAETALEVGKSVTAAAACVYRVDARLKAEGARLSAETARDGEAQG